MDQLETLLASRDDLVSRLLMVPESTIAYITDSLSRRDELVMSVVAQRKHFLSSCDRQRARPYLSTGLFTTSSGDDRTAAIVLSLEAELERHHRALRQRFERYHSAHPALVVSGLDTHVRECSELLSLPVSGFRSDGVFRYNAHWYRLDPFLETPLVRWVQANLSRCPLFLRIDPHFVSDCEPPELLQEATLVPADPQWWPELNIHTGKSKGSQYALAAPSDPRDNPFDHWSYHVQGLRRLEIHAHRQKHSYVSMSIEELVDRSDRDGYAIGRMVHLDFHAARGSSIDAVDASHLDLAINVYLGADARHRLSQNLADGRVCDASFRTHLLRVDAVPPEALFTFARTFFLCQQLVAEWIRDQFPDTGKPVT